ncbi:MAG: ABC transporter ATP-binding protein [Gammaproteobacteria bacterium]|nr:MAG: ABC transporter ATP-binding protein [Gammaproteobacteria bacterium]
MTVLSTHALTIRQPGPDNDRLLCDRLDVELNGGENWAILGANGSGKTTLLHTLAGLRAADDGYVQLGQHNLHGLSHRRRAQQLGVLFQDSHGLFPATVLETVLTSRYPHQSAGFIPWDNPDDKEMALAAIDTVGLRGFEHRSLSTLSGGERRRVDIAALLTQDPALCLMDEPTNHLDLHHQTRLLRLLAQRAAQPKHVNLFVLHDINLALRYCTHGLLMFDGGEVCHGPLPGLIEDESLEMLYHCRFHHITDGRNTFFYPA